MTNSTFLQAPTAHFAIDIVVFIRVSPRLPNFKYYTPFRVLSQRGFRPISISWYCGKALSRSLRGRIRHWEPTIRTNFRIPFIPSILEIYRRLRHLANPATSLPDLNSRHHIHTHPADVPPWRNALYAVNQMTLLRQTCPYHYSFRPSFYST